MSGDLDSLLQQFLRERKYLRNLPPQTLEWYETAWKAFRKSATSCLTNPTTLNRLHLEEFIYSLRDRGVRPVTCNTWLRALNAFCRWLHENGHSPSRVHMRPLKVEKRLVETLDVDAIRAIVNFKPPVAVTVNKHHVNGPRMGQKNFA
jgi:site-specific recombinase XerD